jgi:hypothetical protein
LDRLLPRSRERQEVPMELTHQLTPMLRTLREQRLRPAWPASWAPVASSPRSRSSETIRGERSSSR